MINYYISHKKIAILKDLTFWSPQFSSTSYINSFYHYQIFQSISEVQGHILCKQVINIFAIFTNLKSFCAIVHLSGQLCIGKMLTSQRCCREIPWSFGCQKLYLEARFSHKFESILKWENFLFTFWIIHLHIHSYNYSEHSIWLNLFSQWQWNLLIPSHEFHIELS